MTREGYVKLLQQAAQDIIWHADELIPSIEYRKNMTVSIILEPGSISTVRVVQDIIPPSTFRTYYAVVDDCKAESDKTASRR